MVSAKGVKNKLFKKGSKKTDELGIEPKGVIGRIRRWRWPLIGALAVLLAVVWGMGASAEAPGDLGYPVKRAYESVTVFFTIGRDAKEDRQASYAAGRVKEATNLVHKLDAQTPEQQIASASSIQNLIEEYIKSYNTSTTSVSQDINRDEKFSDKELDDDLKRDVEVYVNLMELRLEVPPAVQATILQGMNSMQNHIAVLQDALKKPPVTPDDSTEISKLVSQGFMTREELTQLLSSTTSNRQLLDTMRNMVKTGQLPTSAVYAINYDLVKARNPKQAARFVASVTFDEMSKIALFTQTITPTPEQKQALQKFLASYKPGDQLPRDELTRAFAMPLVYGLGLTADIPNVVKDLDADELSPVRRSLYDAWKSLTPEDAKDTKKMYSRALQLASASTTRSAVLMERVELEVLNAVRANVAFLAVPAGWTADQVAAVKDQFGQRIKDLKSLETTNAAAETAFKAVADMSAPLVTPATQPAVENVRTVVQKEVVQLQKELVTATAVAADSAAIVPDINKKVTTIQDNFDNKIKALGDTSGITAAEVVALKQAVKDALESALNAHAKLQDSVKAGKETEAVFIDAITAVSAEQTKTATTLTDRISKLDAATQANLAGSTQEIKSLINTNLANLQAELAGAKADAIKAQTQAELNFVSHGDQIALLDARLNLSDAARDVLKAQTDTVVNQLKTDQATLITGLQAKIEKEAALRAQLNDEAKKLIDDIKTEQAQLLTALEFQQSDKEVLKGQLDASIAALQAVQDGTEGRLQSLAGNHGTLVQQLQVIKTDLDKANQTVQKNIDDNDLARAELQRAVDALKDAQTLTKTQIDEGFEAMSAQLRQAVDQLGDAQDRIDLDIAGLSGSVDGVKQSVAEILMTEKAVKLQLDAQAQANLDIRNDLIASVTQLQQAQVATQAQIDGLKTDVGSLKTSVAAISSAQQASEMKVDQLLSEAVNWRSLPGTLAFSQDQFQQYQQQLAAEFAAKSAALQQQFETYKAQLDGSIKQLRTDTNAQLQSLKDEQAALKTQLQQAQQQLQQLQSATTTTNTTTKTPSL